MHNDFATTTPHIPPGHVEWGFAPGRPSLVAFLPQSCGDGDDWILADLTRADPIDPMAREFAYSLLRLAQAELDRTEPASANGANR